MNRDLKHHFKTCTSVADTMHLRGRCRAPPWQISCTSVADAVHLHGRYHAPKWQMPCTSMADITHLRGRCRAPPRQISRTSMAVHLHGRYHPTTNKANLCPLCSQRLLISPDLFYSRYRLQLRIHLSFISPKFTSVSSGMKVK